MADIEEKIVQAIPSLTKSHRYLADYVLKNPLNVVTMPIDELADAAGVSVATANRFARSLGFDGYAAFRSELVRGFEPLLTPVNHLRGNLATPTTVPEVFASVMEESVCNIEATRKRLNVKSCERAVQGILQARRVYILGLGTSAWLGGMLHHGLDSCCDHTQLLVSNGGVMHAVRCLARSGKEDMLIAIAFPRYLDDTVRLVEIAKKRKVKVMALTDSPRSPLVPFADVLLYAQTQSRYRSNCETGVLALIEALVSAVSLRTPDAIEVANRIVEHAIPWFARNRLGVIDNQPVAAQKNSRTYRKKKG